MSGTARAWWYSLWIHEDAVGRGFPKLIHLGWWIFPTLAFQNRFMRPDIHGHQTKIFMFRTCHGHAMVFEYLTFFVVVFFLSLFISCFWIVGGWGMKGCSMVKRDVDFGSFRPPVAIISLGSRWLHVVDFTTFVGAVHQLKARSRDGSRTWDLRMGGCCWELIQWLSFQDRSCSAQWSTETRIFGPFPEASFEYLAKITVNLMGLCHLLVLPNGRRHLRMLFPLSKIEIDRQTFV